MNSAPENRTKRPDPNALVTLRRASHDQLLDEFITLNIQGIVNGDIFRVVGGMAMRKLSRFNRLVDNAAASLAVAEFIEGDDGLLAMARAVPNSRVGEGHKARLSQKWASVKAVVTENWPGYELLQALYASTEFNPHCAVTKQDTGECLDSMPALAAKSVNTYYAATFGPIVSESQDAARSVLTAVAEHRMAQGTMLTGAELDQVFCRQSKGQYLAAPQLNNVVSAVVNGVLPLEAPEVVPAYEAWRFQPAAAMAISGTAEQRELAAAR